MCKSRANPTVSCNKYSNFLTCVKTFQCPLQERDKELELQRSMNQELDMALRLLEKDIHEKQDTVIQLRKQLDDIKTINLEMYNKLQVRDLHQCIH